MRIVLYLLRARGCFDSGYYFLVGFETRVGQEQWQMRMLLASYLQLVHMRIIADFITIYAGGPGAVVSQKILRRPNIEIKQHWPTTPNTMYFEELNISIEVSQTYRSTQQVPRPASLPTKVPPFPFSRAKMTANLLDQHHQLCGSDGC